MSVRSRSDALEAALRTASPVLIAGPVTEDRFADRRTAGGAVSYAARTAAALGLRAYVLVNAAADVDLAPLEGHEVHLVASPRTLVYEHRFEGRNRRMRLAEHPGRRLAAWDAPGAWPRPRTLVLGPLLPDDMDVRSFLDRGNAAEMAILAQGLQRRIDERGWVSDSNSPADGLLAAVDERISLFLSEEETREWPAGALDDLARRARRVVITHGREGAEIHSRSGVARVPALAAQRIDPTGAGDVFATAFILAVRAGEQAAGAIAAAYAAANIERRGPAPLPPLHDILASSRDHRADEAASR